MLELFSVFTIYDDKGVYETQGTNTKYPISMARGKGKRGVGRGSGKRFAAQSAEEIEQRNARLAEFDGDDEEDGSVDSAQKEAEREAMLVGKRVAEISMGEEGEKGEWVEKEYKPKGVEALIEVENPNKAGTNPRMMKMKDLGLAEEVPLTRKEREEKEKAEKAAAYRKRHEAGLTEEYKRDMAKLAEVKARRDAAAAKAKAEQEAAAAAEEARKKAVEAANAGSDDEDDDDRRKKKGGKPSIPKLDKIAIKKMKPAQLKEELKVRGLDIQGSAKQLTERLLTYEQNR